MKSCKVFWKLGYMWICSIFFVVALLVCICVEFKIVCIPCCSFEHITLTLSYGYVSAYIFHLLVNYLPHKRRQKTLRAFVIYKLLRIRELLRQSKDAPFVLDLEQNNYKHKQVYINLFSQKDLNGPYPLSKNKTIFDKLTELSVEIRNNTSELLSYREYLSDRHFQYLNDILHAKFIKEELRPYDFNMGCDDCCSNQYDIGESTFDLYEMSKKQTLLITNNENNEND